ncbi:MAG: hypothetical protein WCO00_02790 [Rhodospirillaceae bacterium]
MTRRIIVVDPEGQGKLAQKNAETAKLLFNTMQDMLVRSFAGRQSITQGDLRLVLGKFEERWATIETLFDRAASESINDLTFIQNDRRKDHLTRLVFARILMKVQERPLAKGPGCYPRAIVTGLQAAITGMFSKPEWTMLNQHAKWVFEFMGGDSDPVILSQLQNNEAVQLFAEPILVALLLRFYRFTVRRSEFVRLINEAGPEAGPKLGDAEFCELFEALFDGYFALLLTEHGLLRVDMTQGEDFLIRVRSVQDQYRRWKEGLNPPHAKRRSGA